MEVRPLTLKVSVVCVFFVMKRSELHLRISVFSELVHKTGYSGKQRVTMTLFTFLFRRVCIFYVSKFQTDYCYMDLFILDVISVCVSDVL